MALDVEGVVDGGVGGEKSLWTWKMFLARSIPTVVICSMDGAPLMMCSNDDHHGTQMPP
jgi:hypothetical protein